jgi:hypothetical protein
VVVLVEWLAHRVSDLRHYLGLFAAPVIWWVQEALFSVVEVPSFLHFQLRAAGSSFGLTTRVRSAWSCRVFSTPVAVAATEIVPWSPAQLVWFVEC